MNNNSNTTLKTLGINELFKTMNLSDTFHTCDIASVSIGKPPDFT